MRTQPHAAQTSRRHALLLAIPTTILFVASIGFAVWLLFASVERLNAVSFDGERRVASSLISANADRLGKVIADYAFWDQMYDQFNGKYDPQWSMDNLDEYSIEAFGIDAVLVTDATGDVRYNYARNNDHRLRLSAADKAELGRVASLVLSGWVAGEPGGQVGVLTIGKVRYMAAAGAIAPNTEARFKYVARPKFILVHLASLNPWAQSISRGFGLSDIAVVRRQDGFTAFPDAFQSNDAAALHWVPTSIGSRFMNEALPPLSAALIIGCGVFGLATFIWILIARRLSSALTAAEAASEAKSEFLALMSHEIRTPLNGVLGMTNALIDSSPTEEQRQGLLTLRGSGESLLRIINDVLDFSKLEAGRIDIETAPFDLHQVIRHAAEICTPHADEKHITLDVAISADVPVHVRGDSGRVRQVLLNLLSNAIKFTPSGQVRLSARTIAASPAGQPTLRVDVCDTGIGIEAAALPALFRQFTQADSSISRRFGGTGLGLAICKKLVDRMGGAIGATSVVGSGSTFWFELPLELASAEEARAIAQAADHDPAEHALAKIRNFGRSVRLLLVDDNATNQLVAKLALEKSGIRPDLAGNGLEAVDAVRHHAYDVILMDMHMPEMDGIEATKAIRALPDLRANTPIIALTANAFASDIDRCIAAGMNGHIGKPFTNEQLVVAIAGALTGAAPSRLRAASEAHETPTAPVLDVQRLETFKSENGEEMLQVLLSGFLDDARGRLERLAELLASGRVDKEAVRIAHSLKSASAMAGAGAFSQAAATLERELASGGSATNAGDTDRLNSLLSDYRHALATSGFSNAA